MELFIELFKSINKHSERPAFFINDRTYTYLHLSNRIEAIRSFIVKTIPLNERLIGLVSNDDLDTYASIIALWFEGRAYVPINSEIPGERNRYIIKHSGIKTILNSKEGYSESYNDIIQNVSHNKTASMLFETDKKELAYLLFTSGTTGSPKGVPITRSNLTSFVQSFDAVVDTIDCNDKWLQMFDLGFDLSVMSYLIPLLKGASVVTIPQGKIKYNYFFKLLEDNKITGALLVPSIIHYLRPYFVEINAKIKYCFFCGEALPEGLVNEWKKCIPEASVINFYGPTENTIFCTYYLLGSDEGVHKTYNGVIAIGKQMKKVYAIVVNDQLQQLQPGEKGELCLGGNQLTPGYWQDEERNKGTFFYSKYKNRVERFYKTGDLCTIDKDGDIFFIGRTDTQVKIQGYRVELSEIEFHAKRILQSINVVALVYSNVINQDEIMLVIESKPFNVSSLSIDLKKYLPVYMLPTRYEFYLKFPYNPNGKIDRNLLKQCFKKHE